MTTSKFFVKSTWDTGHKDRFYSKVRKTKLFRGSGEGLGVVADSAKVTRLESASIPSLLDDNRSCIPALRTVQIPRALLCEHKHLHTPSPPAYL